MPTIKPKSISQSKLARYYELLQISSELESLRKEIIEMALQGLTCQPGRFSCRIKTTTARRPKWKDEFVRQAINAGYDAEACVAGVMDRTPTTQSNSLEIVDRDNPLNA